MSDPTYKQDFSTRPTTLAEIRDLAVIDLWSPTRPNYCGLMGIGRGHGYRLAKRGDLPTVLVGSSIKVSVPAILRLLEEA